MSANFKFQSFAGEDENEGKDEIKTGNPSRQKKKLVPWEISKEEENISNSTTSAYTEEAVRSSNLLISKLLSQLSRFQIALLCVGFLFIIVLITTIGSNGAAIQNNRVLLEFKINETHRIHGLILKRMEEMKERHSNFDGFLKEMMRTLVDESREFTKISLRNFSASHLPNVRSAEMNRRSRFDAVDDMLEADAAASDAGAARLKAEVNRRAKGETKAQEGWYWRQRGRMDRLKRVGESSIRYSSSRMSRRLSYQLMRLKRQKTRDRTDIEELIGKIVEDLRDHRTNFNERIRDLSRDECSDPVLHHCSSFANCTNTISGHACRCKYGFHGDGDTCQDINECDSGFGHECHADAACKNTEGSYACACNSGFVGDGKEKCVDINECVCKMRLCHKLATCINEPGSFKCVCLLGYAGDGIHGCDDVDECENPTKNQCHEDALCDNSVGSYFCNCKSGFFGDGVSCRDIDECSSGAANCSADATCSNMNGSFSCTCHAGFSGDGQTCEDLDECEDPKTTACSPDAFCTNTRGSYGCTCNSGFTGDGLNCTDVDECADIPLNNCSTSATCTNLKGSFRCTCLETHKGDGIDCAVDSMKVSGEYVFHDERKTWGEAKNICRENGGYLAIVGDEAEDRLIRRHSNYTLSDKYWVGGKCEGRTGNDRYYWVRTDVDFSASYPPISPHSARTLNLISCDGGRRGDGIAIKGLFGYSLFAWDDVALHTKLKFVCESEASR